METTSTARIPCHDDDDDDDRWLQELIDYNREAASQYFHKSVYIDAVDVILYIYMTTSVLSLGPLKESTQL